MKKLYTLLAAVLLTTMVWAQSPNKMSYQAVVRDGNNELVSNADIGMQISILQGSADGSSVYTETQTRTSNGNGLVSLEIGMGNTSDDFSTIDWSAGSYFIKTETDPTGGNNYTITGTSQLMSVPYALYAATSGSSTPGPQGAVGPQGPAGADGADGADGSDGSIGATGPVGPAGAVGPQGPAGTDGATGAQGPIGPAGADGVDGLGVAQTIAKSGSLVTLSDGGGSFIDEVNDADFDPINELQTLSKTLNIVSLSNTGGSFIDEVNDSDSDPLNELQDISLTGNELSISDGSTVDLTGIGFDGDFNNLTNVPANLDVDETDDFDGQYSSLSGVPTNVSTFTNDASYLTSFTETDPVFGAAPAAGITNTLMTNWSTAYTWGNHSTAGYLSSEVDGSVSNEIQTLSVLGNDLTISGTGGNTVTLPAGASSWAVNGSDVYRGAGNVGIGIATPAYKLQVNGTSKIQDRLTMGTSLANPLNQGGAILFQKATSGADDFRIETYTIDGLQISGTSLFFGSQTNGIHISDGDHQPVGFVGIGTNTPTEKLEVNGSIKITDGTEGAGKVLTSDADGKASWENSVDDVITTGVIIRGALPIGANCPVGGSYTAPASTLEPGVYMYTLYSCAGQIGQLTSGFNINLVFVSGTGDASYTWHNFNEGSCGDFYTGVVRVTSTSNVAVRYSSSGGSSFTVPGANSEGVRYWRIN